MGEKISYTGNEEADFIEEDPRSQVIKEMTDPDEIKAAQELLEEKYTESDEKDTSVEPPEPEKDTSDESSEDKTETDNETKTDGEEADKAEADKADAGEAETDQDGKEADAESGSDEFKLTDEFIEKQPEENREILSKYSGKDKSELAKATANAIAMKDELLKGKKKLIEAYAEDLLELPEDELLEQLIQSQRETGTADAAEAPVIEDEEIEIELPTLPKDDPKVENVISTEVSKRMKKLYPDMPEDMDSAEYLEWERELQDEKGFDGVDKLLADKKAVKQEVTNHLQTVVYAQENLQNLYFDSPSEIIDYIDEDNLPKLKNINDNYVEINNRTALAEVEKIKSELKTLNLTPEDLGLDLTLTKDANGSYFNPTLNEYLYNGDNVDESLVGMFGKVPILKPGTLANKFLLRNNTLILTHMNSNRAKTDQAKREQLKSETLTNVDGTSSGNKVVAEKDLTKVTDPDALARVMAEIEAKYD